MSPNGAAVAALMRETAAAEILPRFRHLGKSDVSHKKSRTDLVTTADVEAERVLAARLADLLPGSVVVGEEGVEAEPRRLDALGGGDPVWVVDPVDGTNNFVDGKPCFAVIVSLCRGGATRAGWILDPVNDVMVWAAEGEGAWLDDAVSRPRRLAIEEGKTLANLRGSMGWRLGKRVRAHVRAGRLPGPKEVVRYGCTGREYMDLARGSLDFAHYHRLKPWDHAAGILIHREAGGHAAMTDDGGPYQPEPRIMDRAVLMAPDAGMWETLRDVCAAASAEMV